MNKKEWKARYMKLYYERRKKNGGKKLGTNYGRRATDISMPEFRRRFMLVAYA